MTFQRTISAFNSPQIPVRIKNTSGLEIPPNSCVAIGENANLTPGVFTRPGTGFGQGEFLVNVRRPDATAVGSGSPSQFLFTLDTPIGVGKEGYATCSLPTWAAVDSAITARAAKVGPVAGSFKLGSVEGFYHVRDLITVGSDKYGLIEAAAGGGGGSAIIKTPGGGIAARNTTTQVVGRADCVIQTINTSHAIVATSPARSINVCNLSSKPIGGNRYGFATQEETGGRWVITVEDCFP